MTAPLLDLSVVVITLNEAKRLPACLASLPAGCELVVVDSFSSDATCQLAQAAGAQVYQHHFENYATQKNLALSYAGRNWVLTLDADEVLSPALAAELTSLCQAGATPSTLGADHEEGVVAYRLPRTLVFMGRRLRYGKASDRPVRLIRRGVARYQQAIHETLQLQGGGRIASLRGTLWHYSYDDLTDYFARFNDYTTRIARNHFAQGRPQPIGWRFNLRPWFEFANRYFVRLGFLDGYPGYCYALFSSLYAYVKYAKLRELHLEEVNGK